MVFPELMRDAVVSRGDHQILLAAKYMQEVKYKIDSRVRVVGMLLHPRLRVLSMVSSMGHNDRCGDCNKPLDYELSKDVTTWVLHAAGNAHRRC